MTTPLVWNNSLNWALQVGALSVFAFLATQVFRMHSANMRLRWYQMVLAVTLLLPALIPPTRNIVVIDAGSSDGVTVTTGAARAVPEGLSPLNVVLIVLAAGIVLRLLWLGVGFIRLRQYLRASTPLLPATSCLAEADLRVSPGVSGPVTFGFLHPVVLLPSNFPSLTQAQQDAVICHEIMHVRRGDWLWMLGEELVRSVLWFHPAIWWLTAEIRLAREQAVDAEVVDILRTRDEYVDALLAFANVVPSPFAAPVPGFIRRRHLKQRVINILKEVHMSRTRSISTALAATAALAAVAWFTTTALPLRGAPQFAADSPGITVNTNGASLKHRTPITYLISASGPQTAGTVQVEARIDNDGNVIDAKILSGPDELRKAVLQSVLGWHFAQSVAGSVQQISVNYVPVAAAPASTAIAVNELTTYPQSAGGPQAPPPPAPPPPPFGSGIVKQIDIRGLPEQSRQELAATLPVHAGDPLTQESWRSFTAAARKYDEHVQVGMSSRQGSNEVTLSISTPGAVIANVPTLAVANPSAIRIGGNVAQTKLIKQEKPVYPPLAKRARVQGTVQFEATIGKDGHVTNLHLLAGPPLLVQAAMQAVQQWVYEPTLLNGNPVDIITTIDVNFTLSDNLPAPPPTPAPPQ